MQAATANWEKAQTYTWRGNEYVDVPLQFANGSIFTTDNETQTPTKFNVVLRRKGNQYEGAIRTTTYNNNVPALEAGRDTSVVLQNYTLLSGQPGNSWLGNTAGQLRAVTLKALSDVEVRQLREKIQADRGKTKARMAKLECNTIEVTTYETHCYYATMEDQINNNYTCYSVQKIEYKTTCWIEDDGVASGGGSYPPEGNETPSSPQSPARDPDCDSVKNNATKATSVANTNEFNNTKNSIGNISQQSTESGFAFYEKLNVDPYDPDKVTNAGYYASPIQTQNSTTNVTISTTVNHLEGLVAVFHNHPAIGYSAPSANDIYQTIEVMSVNSTRFNKNSFAGNFIEAADGSKYVLTIKDPVKANQFLGTKSSYLDAVTAFWQSGTNIEKTFKDAEREFKKQLRRNPNRDYLAFEKAMAVVLDKYDTGVILNKYDPSSQKYEPIRIRETQTQNGRKTIRTYTNPCI